MEGVKSEIRMKSSPDNLHLPKRENTVFLFFPTYVELKGQYQIYGLGNSFQLWTIVSAHNWQGEIFRGGNTLFQKISCCG